MVAYHPGICFDPISNMADDPGSVLSAGDDLLHSEAVCGKLGVGSDAGGPMTKAVHAKMLRPSAPGLDGFRLPVQHKNATECMPCTPKSLPCMHYGMSSSLAAAKEASLLASSADSGSSPKESASFAEQVTATAHAQLRHHTCSCTVSPRSSAFCISWLFYKSSWLTRTLAVPLGHCCSRRFEPPPAPVRARASLSRDLSSTSTGRDPTFYTAGVRMPGQEA